MGFPIYMGILKTGALAVPFNFRYSSDEILYCANLAEVDVLVFGPEFIGRIEAIPDRKEGILNVKGLWLEPGIRRTKKLEKELNKTLKAFAVFNDCNSFML